MTPRRESRPTSVRWLSLTGGVALVAIAFAAATRVADTREGLISEVITLLAGLVGISSILYGLFANARPSTTTPKVPLPASPEARPTVRSANALVIGGGGIALAAVLLAGLAISGGVLWAGLGLVLLLPMVVGSAYLCMRFLRSPERDWRIDLRRLRSRKKP
jgi:hypothetical protein